MGGLVVGREGGAAGVGEGGRGGARAAWALPTHVSLAQWWEHTRDGGPAGGGGRSRSDAARPARGGSVLPRDRTHLRLSRCTIWSGVL